MIVFNYQIDTKYETTDSRHQLWFIGLWLDHNQKSSTLLSFHLNIFFNKERFDKVFILTFLFKLNAFLYKIGQKSSDLKFFNNLNVLVGYL